MLGYISSIVREHNKTGGSTFNTVAGNLKGQDYWVVSPYPERTRIIGGPKITREDVTDYVRANLDLLMYTHLSIGTWYNGQENVTYFDIVETVEDRAVAEMLARQHNQQAIYSLEGGFTAFI